MVTQTGKLSVDAASTFTDDDILSVTDGASAVIFGQLTVDDYLLVDTGGTIDDWGTVSMANGAEMEVDATNSVAGTFAMEPTGIFQESGGNLTNVIVAGNFLTSPGDQAAIDGSFTVDSNTSVTVYGSFIFAGPAGVLTVDAGDSGTPAGSFTVKDQGSSLTLEEGGGAMIGGFLEIDHGSSLEVESGATLTDQHSVNIDGTVGVALATSPASPQGTVLIDAGSTFTVSSGATATVLGSMTNVQGLLVVNSKLTEKCAEREPGG